jgi:hypothetical protein
LAKQLAAEIVAVRPLLCKNHNYVAEFWSNNCNSVTQNIKCF